MTIEEAYKKLQEELQVLIIATTETEGVVQEKVLVYGYWFEELKKIVAESERWEITG